ncbi:MAG: hypothetical protein V3R64_08225 [Sphingomonadales bacterium]
MSHTIRIMENGGIHLEYEGIVTSKETSVTDAAIYNNPDHPLSRVPVIIADFSKVDAIDISYEQLRSAGIADREILKNNPGLVFAVIAERDQAFGMARVWQAFLDDLAPHSRIFRTLDEAQTWLKSHKKLAS